MLVFRISKDLHITISQAYELPLSEIELYSQYYQEEYYINYPEERDIGDLSTDKQIAIAQHFMGGNIKQRAKGEKSPLRGI